MNARRVAWLVLLILAAISERHGAVTVHAAVAEDPPSQQPAPPNAEGAAKPPAPADADPGEKPTNAADYTYTTDEAIELFELRVKVHSRDHTSYATLGDLYERKARETDDLACFAKAEAALRKALELFPDYPRAKVSLAVVLCDRHQFAEALEVAKTVLGANPKDLDALAAVGDAQLELGRYAEAERSLRELVRRLPAAAPALARLARLEELKGHTEEALQLLRRAATALRTTGAPPVDLAWYQFREADMLFNAGRIDEAGRVDEAVLTAVPGHHDATAGLARVRAAQGRRAEAITLYEKAVAIAPDPAMLVALGDLYAEAGDAEAARTTYDRLVHATSGQPEHRRSLSLFYSDHDLNPAEALELARKDIDQRQDIYAHDALAWALLKNDRPEEASQAIAEALRLGTPDARLFFHAGMIYRRLGDTPKARDHLGRALALNPHFSPKDAERARRILAELETSGKDPGAETSRPR